MTDRAPILLLLQVRDRTDRMAAHERQCLGRRVGSRRLELRAHNALIDRIDPSLLDGANGLIVGGSGAFSVHDPRSARWLSPLRRLLERALVDKLPGFGICFGHQLLGHHLGARVTTDPERAEIGTVELSLTAIGRRDPVFSGLPRHFSAHTGHSDCVVELPPGVQLLAHSERLRAQAFKVRDAPFRSTQFHPDMTGAEATVRYLAYRESLNAAVGDSERDGLAAFRSGADETTILLAHFADLVAHHGSL